MIYHCSRIANTRRPNRRHTPIGGAGWLLFLALAVLCSSSNSIVAKRAYAQPAANAVCNWMTAGSYYTHQPGTEQRVHQFAPDPVVIHTPDPTASVYRQQRSSLAIDGSFDQYHKVYRFGDEVRPYGEWQRPFRPFSVPFSDWAYGSPFGHLAYPPRTNPNLPPSFFPPNFFPGQGFPGQGFPGQGFPGQGFPGQGFPGQGFPGQGFPGQGFPGQGFPGQGFPGQGFPGQGFPGQGFPGGQNGSNPSGNSPQRNQIPGRGGFSTSSAPNSGGQSRGEASTGGP